MAVTTITGTNMGAAGTAGGNARDAAGDGIVLSPKTRAKLVVNASATGGAGYGYGQTIYYQGRGTNGGVGIHFTGDGALNSFGTIAGGAGGTGAKGPRYASNDGGNGGVGLLFAGSRDVSLLNHGVIEGGAGAYSGVNPGAVNGSGGVGVALDSGGFAINSGVITGGAGNGLSVHPQYLGQATPDGGIGGDGVYFGADGTLKNHGTITGGAGGYGGNRNTGGQGGSGVEMSQIGTVTNTKGGDITGGQGGQGHPHGGDAGSGGAGILLDAGGLGGLVVNDAGASIIGGQGGAASTNPYLYTGGIGGDGVDAAAGGDVLNHGTIIGGQGGLPDPNAGGNPVNLTAVGGVGVNLGGGVLHNSGTISGGEGGPNGGPGGIGLISSGGGNTASNSGLIIGGQGQQALAQPPAIGGYGVLMTGSGTFINNGVVSGGSNAPAGMLFATGGDTLINNGTIDSGNGADGTAVNFNGAGSDLLVIDAASTFIGGVTAAGSNNVLELTGTAAGTLDDPQDAFQGFDTLQVNAGSTWSLSGSATDLINNGTIDIQGGDSLAVSTVDPNSAGVFQLTGIASLTIGTLLGTNTQIAFSQAPIGDGVLNLSDPSSFGLGSGDFYAGPLLENFGQGDLIDLQGIGYAGDSTSYDNVTGILQVQDSASNVVASLHFQDSSLGGGAFQLIPDGAGGSLLLRGIFA